MRKGTMTERRMLRWWEGRWIELVVRRTCCECANVAVVVSCSAFPPPVASFCCPAHRLSTAPGT